MEVTFGALLSAGITIFLSFVAGLIWLIRLEGRVNLRDALCNAQDARTTGLETRILEELSSMRGEFRGDMQRIYDRLDNKQDKSQ